MTSIRAAILAAVLIVPGSALAASDETAPASVQSATEKVLPAGEPDRVAAQEIAPAPGREMEAFARAAPARSYTKARSWRPSRAAHAAPAPQHHQFGCSGYWCGRQFVLMIGIGF
jgi:protein-disulfide isomerase